MLTKMFTLYRKRW